MRENPQNNDIIQGLLDLRKAAAENGDDELAAQARALYENVSRKNRIAREAQKIYRAHRYRNITYAMQLVYDEHTSVLCTLSNAARLVWQAYTICAANQYVQLTREQISHLSGIKDKHTITKAVKELLDKGLMTQKRARTNREAAIYRLNPLIVRVGKMHPSEDDGKILADHDTEYRLITAKIDDGESPYYYTMLATAKDEIEVLVEAYFGKAAEDSGKASSCLPFEVVE